jgi:nucleoside-diphosphate-sugar epimerase
MKETHVVFGANGALGSAIVRTLVGDGVPVRSVVYDEEEAKDVLPPGTAIVYGDATDPDGAKRACRGATIIYHCVNVPQVQWLELLPQIHENIVNAARESRALVVFPGNVMGYGPFQQLPAKEDHPLAAETRKGRLRNAMEQRLTQAHQAGEISTVIPRFPDLYGPEVTNPQMAPLFRAALSGKTGTWPGNLDVPHNLLYVEDAARACVLLATTPDSHGEVWHVPGPGALTGRQFIEMAFEAASNRPRVRPLGRTLFRFFGALIPNAGEMVEMLYLYEQPMLLDGRKFAQAFPSFEYTPHREAVRRTVEWFSEYYPPQP